MSNSSDEFVELNLKRKSLDIFYVRNSIFKSIQENITVFNGKLLDIGCGKMPYRSYLENNSNIIEYIGLDIEQALTYDKNIEPDFTWDGITMPFESNSFETSFGTEVLEHCSEPEVVLKEVLRVLKPGGTFFFTVPFLWNLHETPNDYYRYTPYSLERHLKNSGFENIKLEALGGWHASLAQMLGLWVRRSPMSNKKRILLSIVLKPLIKGLIALDGKQNVQFKEGQMITGLCGIAKK